MIKATIYSRFATPGKLLLCWLLLAATLQPARAQLQIYPGDTPGYTFDVTEYGANGQDDVDDTDEIQAAIDAIMVARVNSSTACMQLRAVGHATLYFPNGTYKVSRSLSFGGRPSGTCTKKRGDGTEYTTNKDAPQLQIHVKGENRNGTMIRLKDNTFKTVPSSGSSATAQTVFNFYESVSGNDLFSNTIEDLTIQTGSGNPGAIGLNYHNNNVGYVRRVTIVSADREGAIGLRLGSQLSGIGLVQSVSVTGFDYGIVNGGNDGGDYHVTYTLENITLSEQRKAGIRSRGKGLSIRKLVSTNTVPAVVQEPDSETATSTTANGSGQVVIVESELKGGDFTVNNTNKSIAILNNAGWILTNSVKTEGYKYPLQEKGVVKFTAPNSSAFTIPDYATGGTTTLFGSTTATLNLPVEETPAGNNGSDQTKWVVIDPDDEADDAIAIQAAISGINSQTGIYAGKETIFLKRGQYTLNSKIQLKGGRLKRINANWSKFTLGTGLTGSTVVTGTPVFEFLDNTTTPSAVTLVIEAIDCAFEFSGKTVFMKHSAQGTLVLKDSFLPYGAAYSNTSAGTMFVENVCSGGSTSSQQRKEGWFIKNSQKFYARSLNHEGTYPHLVNDNATVWVLGFKFGEDYGDPYILAKGGGKTELLGGILNALNASEASAERAAIVNEYSEVSVSLVERARERDDVTPNAIKETQVVTYANNTTAVVSKTLSSTTLPKRQALPSYALALYRGKIPASPGGRVATLNEDNLADQKAFFYPNPATGETTIVYNLPEPAWVVIDLYDSQGKKVKPLLNSYQSVGKHQLVVNGQLLANGLYICRLQANQRVQSTKLLISK
ncbi:MAG: T9SS type A sorting domain-containing protein [Bacteroidetes bacterium]|nr:T9SS type A sorting domain-containing protein [Fibrella sp.]